MLALIGGTCAGKSTIVKELCKHDEYRKALEVTTRRPRPGEQNGVDYWFTTPEHFAEMEENGELVGIMNLPRIEDGVLKTVRYAALKKDIDDPNPNVVLATNAGALKLIKQYNPNVYSVKLVIDESVQLKRLKARGDLEEEAKRRIASDREALASVTTDAEVDNSFTCIWCTAEEIKSVYESSKI